MSALAVWSGPINLDQGFPDTDSPEEVKGVPLDRSIDKGPAQGFNSQAGPLCCPDRFRRCAPSPHHLPRIRLEGERPQRDAVFTALARFVLGHDLVTQVVSEHLPPEHPLRWQFADFRAGQVSSETDWLQVVFSGACFLRGGCPAIVTRRGGCSRRAKGRVGVARNGGQRRRPGPLRADALPNTRSRAAWHTPAGSRPLAPGAPRPRKELRSKNAQPEQCDGARSLASGTSTPVKATALVCRVTPPPSTALRSPHPHRHRCPGPSPNAEAPPEPTPAGFRRPTALTKQPL
ncbi:hypothetical protein CG747_14430 [Streptomyces sp. CB02959]|nr:hypothetical protein CG747_14430 [Streptomyces sp. CB02959]